MNAQSRIQTQPDHHSQLLMRLLTVSAGLVAATLLGSLAAAYGASLMGRPEVSSAWLNDPSAVFAALKPPFSLLMMTALSDVTTIWKVALIGIAAAEIFAIRSFVFQAANGAVAAFLTSELYMLGAVPGFHVLSPDLMLTAGLVGGMAYWAVAGWTAGFQKPIFIAAPIIPTLHKGPRR